MKDFMVLNQSIVLIILQEYNLDGSNFISPKLVKSIASAGKNINNIEQNKSLNMTYSQLLKRI